MKKLTILLTVLFSVVAILCVTYILVTFVDKDIRRATELSYDWTKEYQSFTDEICKDSSSDKEKVLAIYDWVITNISYDYDADPMYQSIEINRTVTTRKGICFDFANLFTMMCRSQGIPCYSVDGYKKDDENSLHTWNRVYYDENWWNCDVTFDSIRLKANKSLYGFLRLGNSARAPDEKYVVTRIY